MHKYIITKYIWDVHVHNRLFNANFEEIFK
jgi:hypothetical protein